MEAMRPKVEAVFRLPGTELEGVRVVQTNSPGPGDSSALDLWSIFDMRIFAGGAEVQRSPGWRIWAMPNPWGAELAFDSSPVTRWRTWERIRAGMFLQAEFGRAEKVEEVRLLISDDQYGVKMRLEGKPQGGDWRELQTEPVKRSVAVPLTLRRMAIRELRRGGITHLLLHEDDYAWADLSKNAQAWGIREIGSVDAYHLFQLE
jgi:hypothetical protein